MKHFSKWLEGQLGGIEAPSQERGGVPLSILGASHGNSKGAFMTGGDKPPTPVNNSEDETRYQYDIAERKKKNKMLNVRRHQSSSKSSSSSSSSKSS